MCETSKLGQRKGILISVTFNLVTAWERNENMHICSFTEVMFSLTLLNRLGQFNFSLIFHRKCVPLFEMFTLLKLLLGVVLSL